MNLVLFTLILILHQSNCFELNDLKKPHVNNSFNYLPKDEFEHESLQRRETNILTPSQQEITKKDNNDPNAICLYSNIRLKLDYCFKSSNECKSILDCIHALQLVDKCQYLKMYTPAIWIINVFEILQENNFCKIPIGGCPNSDIDLTENQYLIKLNEVLISMNNFGPAYLNQPKLDNKIFCSKSHNLVSNVRDLFDSLDQCNSFASMDSILNLIEDTADIIYDKNCLYCISGNSYFDDCEMFNFNNENNCNISLKCIYEKIDLYKCNKEKDETPLSLLSTFMTNINFICNTNASEANLVTEWFKSLNSCIRDRRYLGLTYVQAPPRINLCQEMEETYKCIHNTLNDYKTIRNRVKQPFAIFSRHFDKLQRTCDLLSLIDMEKASINPTPTPINVSTRHPFQNNSEQTVLEDNKLYYHQTIIRAELDQTINWIDIDSSRYAPFLVKHDEDLSKNYLKATVVKLKFKFPYYGHLLDQIVVATGGFIYVGSLMNPLITKAQYIAPLMANFDPTLSNNTVIKYVDNTTHFICTWQKLILQDQPENGEYTFQVVLNKNGDISFNYRNIPNLSISNISHTVKIGISDAYIYFKVLSNAKIEYTIVQYHSIGVTMENVKTGNSVMFYMLKNCIQLKTCETCMEGVGNFKCLWCPQLQRCSDTMDRHRQEWIESSCPIEKNSISKNVTCQAFLPNSEKTSKKNNKSHDLESDSVKNVLIGIFVTILIAMTLTLSAWVVYAYRNPNSASGIWLIEHRPQRLFSIINNNIKRETTRSTRFENPEV